MADQAASGGSGGGGSGGTIFLSASLLNGVNQATFSAAGGNGAGAGRILLAANNSFTSPTLSNGEGLGTFTGERTTNAFLTSAAATPYLPDTLGGPAAAGLVTDAAGFEGQSQLDILKATISGFPLSFASLDSPFVGFDELFVSNLSSAPIQNLGLTINGIGTTAIGTLGPGESWTTLVPDGQTQGIVAVTSAIGGQTFDTSGLGSNVIVGVPEPSTVVLLAIAAASLIGFGWRRRRHVTRRLLAVVLLVSVVVAAAPKTVMAATIAYWRFEEGPANSAATGSILDSSGNGLNGTPIGGPVYSTNVPVSRVPQTDAADHYSLSFNGSSQRIFIADNPKFQLTQSLTLEAYINLHALPTHDGGSVIIFRGDDRNGLDPYSLAISPDGRLFFRINDGTVQNGPFISAPLPSLDTWFYVAGTLDNQTGAWNLYINSSLVASTTTSIRPFGLLQSNQEPGLGIGDLQSNYGLEYFNGLIDEVRISDQALTPNQLLGAVPEPSSLVLLTIAAASLIGFSWRQRRHQQ